MRQVCVCVLCRQVRTSTCWRGLCMTGRVRVWGCARAAAAILSIHACQAWIVRGVRVRARGGGLQRPHRAQARESAKKVHLQMKFVRCDAHTSRRLQPLQQPSTHPRRPCRPVDKVVLVFVRCEMGMCVCLGRMQCARGEHTSSLVGMMRTPLGKPTRTVARQTLSPSQIAPRVSVHMDMHASART